MNTISAKVTNMKISNLKIALKTLLGEIRIFQNKTNISTEEIKVKVVSSLVALTQELALKAAAISRSGIIIISILRL